MAKLKVKESVRRIQEFPAESLARKDVNQGFDFSAAVEPAERLIRLYSRFSLSTMDDVPEEHLDAIKRQADVDYDLLQRLLTFDPTNVNPAQTYATLVRHLRDGYKAAFDQLNMFISHESERKWPSTNQTAVRDVAITAVKWLIPSLSVLMVLLGYISESAHQALLGFDFGNLGTTEYIWATGAVVREILLILVLGPFNGRPLFRALDFETIFGTFLVLVLFFLLAIAWRLIFHNFTEGARRGWQITILAILAMITLLRLFTVDLPLTRIENLLVSGASSVEKLLSEAPTATVPKMLWQFATGLYEVIVCARDPTVSTEKPPIHCTSEGAYRVRLDRVFGITALSTLIVIGFGMWLFFNSPSLAIVVAAGLLVLYSVFALPYSYGKLKRSTEYELAVVQLKTPILDSPSAEVKHAETPGVTASRLGASEIPNAATEDLRLQPAMVLVRGDRFVKLYVDHRVTCSSGTIVYEWRFWESSVSEIVLMREIQRKDVIELKFSKGPAGCEPLTSP